MGTQAPAAVAAVQSHPHFPPQTVSFPRWTPKTDGIASEVSPSVDRTVAASLRFRVLKKTGLRHIRPHDLRHTCATWLLAGGASLVYVRDLLGHSSIQVTTDIYGDRIPRGDRSDVNRLDDPLNEARIEEKTE